MTLAALLTGLRQSGAPTSVTWAVAAAWLLPTDALLNSTLVLLLFFALPNWPAVDEGLPAPRSGLPNPLAKAIPQADATR